MTKTILILGANGKFGHHCAKAFAADGWTVRLFDRKTQNMTKAALGVDVIFNGLNPPKYHNWAKIIPEITAQVIAAAKSSGATVILPGNVYPFGSTPGTWSEATPHLPNSRKGEIRKTMEAAYRDAATEGVQTINLRAGDIIDPVSSDTVMAMVIFKNVTKGKMTYLGRTDIAHAWCYTPDFARAAVALANIRAGLAPYEDVPIPGQNLTGQQICEIARSVLGRPVRPVPFPWWMLNLLGPVWELARELNEMRYLWDTAHRLSGDKFRRLVPDFAFTPASEAVAKALLADIHPNQPVVAANVTA